MPPKTSAPAGKVFSADVVAALIMSFNVTSITSKQYELMSAMDGEKTASAFQHDFRSVLAKAKELKARVEAGEEFKPVQPGKKRSATTSFGNQTATPPATPKKPKATPKPRSKKGKGAQPEEPELDDEEDDMFSEKVEDYGNDFIKKELDYGELF